MKKPRLTYTIALFSFVLISAVILLGGKAIAQCTSPTAAVGSWNWFTAANETRFLNCGTTTWRLIVTGMKDEVLPNNADPSSGIIGHAFLSYDSTASATGSCPAGSVEIGRDDEPGATVTWTRLCFDAF